MFASLSLKSNHGRTHNLSKFNPSVITISQPTHHTVWSSCCQSELNAECVSESYDRAPSHEMLMLLKMQKKVQFFSPAARWNLALFLWRINSGAPLKPAVLCSLLFQAVHTPRPCSRLLCLCFHAAIARSIFTQPSQAACSVPAASTQKGVWTVAVETVEVHWCVSAQEGVGSFTGSHPGVMPAGHSSPLVSTPKSPHLAPGYAK